MVITIVTHEPFPIGMAATNHIISLARGFREEGSEVKVVILRPTESNGRLVNIQARGTYNGIEFEYAPGTTVPRKTFLLRRYDALKRLVNAFVIIRQFHRQSRGGVLLVYWSAPFSLVYLACVARLLGLAFVLEKTEFPFYDRRQTVWSRLYTAYVFRLFDGVLVMTKALARYFASRIRQGAELLIVPMTVEASRFVRNDSAAPEEEAYIAYCGPLDGYKKDGVPLLIEAFSRIAGRHPDVSLRIIGGSRDPRVLEDLQALTERLGVTPRVVFAGQLRRDEVPRYLCNARVLALARPEGVQAHYGFPTKLGEYLATGRPVVVTRVGEIAEYLEDGKSAYLVAPGDVDAFAERLSYVLSHEELASEVGLNGRRVAMQSFDYATQARSVLALFRRLTTE